MKIQFFIYKLFFLFTILLVFAACQPAEYSVFRAVIDAKSIPDNSLNNALTITGMTDDGTDYFLATGFSMWTRAISLNDSTNIQWTSIPFPAGVTQCIAYAWNGTNLYAAFLQLPDNTYSLWKGDRSLTPGWNQVNDANIGNKQVTRLFMVNSVLFANVSSTTNTLYYLNAGNFIATGITDVSNPVTSIAWDGTEYWAVTSQQLYRSNTLPNAFAAFTNPPAKGDTDTYNTIFYSSLNRYYLSLSNGIVYSTLDPDTTWTGSSEQLVGTKKVYFTEFAEINSNILIGTNNYGFFQTLDGDVTKIIRYSDELVSDINQSTILNFYVQPGLNMVFFLTGSNGLYRSIYTTANGWQNLTHE